MSANETQIGGDHYVKHSIQPWDVIAEYKLNFWLGNAVKYILRHEDKGGVQDLMKARHYLDYVIENMYDRVPTDQEILAESLSLTDDEAAAKMHKLRMELRGYQR